ncbi:hypothetical protein OE88DRAFT_1737010 [Heliocybe sulcata]|uniref:Uncharacterized protein n=1 Tax=Heliocybe sulcata TaxID=5364 RepID=A0A5C3N6J7_9AGAM|nr:hypothetical protein OE88DRAFT_1737010 [Heliocybe sulcata]
MRNWKGSSDAVAAIPGAVDLYFLDGKSAMNDAKQYLYCLNVWIQDLLLVRFGGSGLSGTAHLETMRCAFESLHIGTGYHISLSPSQLLRAYALPSAMYAVAVFGRTDQVPKLWALLGWSLDLALNVSLTLAIAYRLWSAHQEIAATLAHKSGSKAAMYTVVESGAIFAIATLVLEVRGNLGALIGINTVIQLATITPLLIIVRVGLGLSDATTYGSTEISKLRAAVRPIQVDVSRSTEGDHGYPSTALSTYESNRKPYSSLEDGHEDL